MAVVSFWGNNTKETGQTLSVVALGTEMAIDHNNKILIVSTGFNETTMEDCFWEKKRNNGIIPENGVKTGGIANGFEGLIKVIQSNRTSSNIIRDYAKVVFKSRLDVLPAPTTRNPKMYNTITSYYKDVLNALNIKAEETVMIGNDVLEDGIASKLGIKVILISDCLLNPNNLPTGNFEVYTLEELYQGIKNL